MIFYTRFGYLVAVFSCRALLPGESARLSSSSRVHERFVAFVLGAALRGFRKKTRSSGKRSTLFGIPMEYWGMGSSASEPWTPMLVGTTSRAIGSPCLEGSRAARDLTFRQGSGEGPMRKLGEEGGGEGLERSCGGVPRKRSKPQLRLALTSGRVFS